MTHGRTFGLAAAALFAVGATFNVASAQEEVVIEEAGPNLGAISLAASVDWTNEYWFRGIPQEDQGFILQPGLDIGIALYSGDTFSVDAYVGTWNSLHFDAPTGTGTFGCWFEADWYIGLAIGLPYGFGLDVSYVNLYGPNVGAQFAEEIDVNISWDDSEVWGDTGIPGWTGLQPYALFAFETEAGSDYGAVVQEQGIYLELGIAPGFTLIESADYPVDVSIPLTLGLGLDDYYQYADVASGAARDEDFGFFDAGIVASMPLAFVPADYGSWSVSAGIHFLFTNEDFVQGTLGAPNYDEFRIVGTVGIAMEY